MRGTVENLVFDQRPWKVRLRRGQKVRRRLSALLAASSLWACSALAAEPPQPATDASCLAIEQAFADNRISELAALKPQEPRWQAQQSFRLASAYIPQDRKDEALQAIRRGLKVVARGLRDDPDDVELLLLGTMLDGEYLLINRWRFLHNGLRGLRRIARAEKLAPDNPRARLIRGSAKVVLPGIFGGSATEALAILQPGVRDTELCAGGDWGQVDLLNWLGRAASALDDSEQARHYFEQALARSPGNHWVRLAIAGEGYRWEEEPDAQGSR
jgi:tetratricopeptide (TPR) repeat protein